MGPDMDIKFHQVVIKIVRYDIYMAEKKLRISKFILAIILIEIQ